MNFGVLLAAVFGMVSCSSKEVVPAAQQPLDVLFAAWVADVQKQGGIGVVLYPDGTRGILDSGFSDAERRRKFPVRHYESTKQLGNFK
ncbi:MAG: hypothetical protein R3F11_19620 [Verrucomicrobiales bacterium]